MTNATPHSGRSVSYLTWRLTTTVITAIVLTAVGCLVGDLVIWGLTFASPSIAMPDWIFAPFVGFALAGSLITIVAIGNVHRRRWFDALRLAGQLPTRLRAGLMVVGAVFLVTGPVELFSRVPGQPSYNAFTHEYYFQNHQEVIPTDRAHYLSAVATQTRAFLSFALFFTCCLILLGGAEMRRRRAVVVPPLREIPRATSKPRLCPAAPVGLTVGALGLVVLSGSFAHIVQRVDSYLRQPSAVTTAGVTENLSAGPWVVFTWCQTHTTDAPYGCPPMASSDIVIEAANGELVPTALDPSTDHISPAGLPAAGQLTFSVAQSGFYSLRLTRDVPKGVFVAESPGTIARSLVLTILLGVVGLAALAAGVALLLRRVGWRLQAAPMVIDPGVDLD
jgi:hypothetical protein